MKRRPFASRRNSGSFAQLLCLLMSTVAYADIRLPSVLGDHMVLQRDAPIHFWGLSDPEEAVSVEFAGKTQSATADSLGQWSVYLPALKAGGPYQAVIRGSNKIVISDILIGDVWLASGQSNMEMPLEGFPGSAVLKDGPDEIARANHPEIRLSLIPRTTSEYPLADNPTTWTICTPHTAARFSAVAYFFGRELHETQKVPIGLIDATWGATPAEAWISLSGISSDPRLMPIFAVRAQSANEQQIMPLILAKEKREDAEARAAGQPPPQHPYHGHLAEREPSALYNGMIAPLTPFSIKGAIWYQGETNSGFPTVSIYDRILSALIRDWRTQWHEGNFPFIFAQISGFAQTDQSWGLLRDRQRAALDVADTAMAVTYDVGDPNNVHPADKQTVGHRMALVARALVYHEAVEYSGPLYRQASIETGGMRVWFTHVDRGFQETDDVTGFEIAGADHLFQPAAARIDGETVLVQSKSVPNPKFVRYAWSNAPVANLKNQAGLPASTFTSEDLSR